MDLNKIFTTGYRWLAIKFLILIFAIAFGYAFLVVFFAISSSWAVPMELSPSQARVLSFQPQIAGLQANLDKQKIDLVTAEATVLALSEQTTNVRSLLSRADSAMRSESAQLAEAGKAVSAVLADKKLDISATEAATKQVRVLLKHIDDELAAKLITSDQAASRRISLQAALNAGTDARSQALQLSKQASDLKQGAATLNGGASSIAAIVTVKQLAELRALSAQLEIQLTTAKATIVALTQSIAEGERVLGVAKNSPYYAALYKPVSVAFIPYENRTAKIGDAVYDCWAKILFCSKAGSVIALYEAEEYSKHPLFKSDLKGRLVGIEFSDSTAFESQVVFIGGKPLFF